MSKPPSPHPGRGSGRGAVPRAASPDAPPLPTLSPDGERTVTLAVVTGAHGVTGEVRLKVFADDLSAHRVFNGGALTATAIRVTPQGAIVRFAQVTDRTAAEALRGTALTVPRAALPPLGEGEYYHADLIGLPAVSTAGVPLGRVVAIDNYGAGDVIEIERDSGKRFMVPMSVEAVPEWDDLRLVVRAEFATE